jgi:hypothetical protein
MGGALCSCLASEGVQILSILVQQLGLDFSPEEWEQAHNSGTVEENSSALSSLAKDLKTTAPPTTLTRAVLIACNTYTRPDYSLGVGPMNDAITVAHYMGSIGFNVYFIHNPTSAEFKQNLTHFLKNTTKYLLCYYTGHGASVADTSGDEADGKDECLVFDDAFVKDDELAKLLSSSGKPSESKVCLINDCCHSGSIWDLSGNDLPPNVLSLSAAKDSETAKQTSMEGGDRGIFTFYFFKLLSQSPNMTPTQMEAAIAQYLKRFEQAFTKAATTPTLMDQPIFQ